MKLKSIHWRILIAFVVILITIVLFKNQIFRYVERLTSSKLNNSQTCNYLNINDDGTILKNKFDYYKFPNALGCTPYTKITL